MAIGWRAICDTPERLVARRADTYRRSSIVMKTENGSFA